MVFFTLFLLFVFPFLQAGPLDNWVSFLTWMVFIVIPLIVCVLLCITVTHEDNNDSKKNSYPYNQLSSLHIISPLESKIAFQRLHSNTQYQVILFIKYLKLLDVNCASYH